MSNNQEKLNEQLFNVIADEKVSDEARLKKLKYLVRLGADVNAKLYGKSVLSKAIEKNASVEVQNFLREKGANEWVISKEEALELSQGFWADRGFLKSLDEIKSLLKKGADINAKNKDGETALMKVARWGELELVKCLVENGADAHQKDNWGETVLMKAARWGHIEVIKCLVENGADVNASDKYGQTVLFEAAQKGQIGVVKYLAENGADIEARDNYERTALDIARKWEKADCVEFLEEYQKKVSAQRTKGDKTGVSQIVKKNEGR